MTRSLSNFFFSHLFFQLQNVKSLSGRMYQPELTLFTFSHRSFSQMVNNYMTVYNCISSVYSELGHVVQRKFTTDIVLKRLSATSIETVNHEFYKLVGYLNDYKHGRVSKIW